MTGRTVGYFLAQSVYSNHSVFQSDVMVLSCDVISDLSLHRLADVHRTHDATVTALFSSIPETSADREAAANPKVKKKKDNTSKSCDQPVAPVFPVKLIARRVSRSPGTPTP